MVEFNGIINTVKVQQQKLHAIFFLSWNAPLAKTWLLYNKKAKLRQQNARMTEKS